MGHCAMCRSKPSPRSAELWVRTRAGRAGCTPHALSTRLPRAWAAGPMPLRAEEGTTSAARGCADHGLVGLSVPHDS